MTPEEKLFRQKHKELETIRTAFHNQFSGVWSLIKSLEGQGWKNKSIFSDYVSEKVDGSNLYQIELTHETKTHKRAISVEYSLRGGNDQGFYITKPEIPAFMKDVDIIFDVSPQKSLDAINLVFKRQSQYPNTKFQVWERDYRESNKVRFWNKLIHINHMVNGVNLETTIKNVAPALISGGNVDSYLPSKYFVDSQR